MSAAIENLKQDREALIAELERAGARMTGRQRAGGGEMFRCFHGDDHNASGSLFKKDDGAWAARCFACGETWDVWALRARNEGCPVETVMSAAAKQAAGGDCSPVAARTASPAAHASPGKAPRRFPCADAVRDSFGERLAASYAYTCPATGRIDLFIVRTADKAFFQFHQDAPQGELIAGAPPKPWPIYNRARLADAPCVVVVEGEKDVHSLHALGVVATTSPGGAMNAAHADWRPLAGKDVILWPDFDEPGAAYAATVRGILEKLNPPPRLAVIDPALLSLGPKEDVSDFLAQFADEPEQTRARLLHETLSAAEPLGPAADLKRQLGDIAAGRRRAIHFCHGLASKLTQALLPGAITIVCGSPGASKSFWVQEVLMRLHQSGVAVALLHLEEDRTFHLRRALAQLAGAAGMTDETWVADHAQEALALADSFAHEIQSFGACITDAPAQGAAYSAVVAFVEAQAAAGARVVAVDPITLADPGEHRKPWEADRALMASLKAAAIRHGCSVILVSHPSKGAQGGFLDSVAGGAAFQRAAQTIFWLEHLAAPMEDAMIHTAALTFRPDSSEPINRVLHVAKARNGKGTGARIGFFFDPQTLRSKELGIIEQTGKGRKKAGAR